MYRQQLIKEIRDNQKDMEKSLIENQASGLIPLFKDYTDEIIKLVESKLSVKEKKKNNDVGCPVSDDCSPSGCVTDISVVTLKERSEIYQKSK